MTSYLFVYGTLLSGLGHPMHELLTRHAGLIGSGYINGKLYDVASYPGLVLSNNTLKVVRGEIYHINDEQELFNALDKYEGCAAHSPKPYEYQRNLVSIQDAALNSVLAWSYLYKRPVSHLPLIPAGDYLAFRNKRPLKFVNG